MQIRQKMAVAMVTLSMLIWLVGGMGFSKEKTALAENLKLDPTHNEDGNYNIIFITTDQERYFHEYPEGAAFEARELLASLGTTFEKHYACSTMSTSSRSVIFTGKHIIDTKMIDNTDFGWQGELSREITTVGDRMRSAGYYTALKGKWHMGNASTISEVEEELTDLQEYGFSDWGVDGDYIGTLWEGFEKDTEIIAHTIEWLHTIGLAQNAAGKSFFLSVNLINPHDIMYFSADENQSVLTTLGGAPDDPVYEKKYDVPIPSSWNRAVNDGTLPSAIPVFKHFSNRISGVIQTEDAWKAAQDFYFNCIQDSDNHLMVLLLALIDMQLLDNSIIIFTSDHGEMGGAHGLKGKGGLLFEQNLHVPLVIYHPEFSGGQSVQAVTSHVDLATTFIHMTSLSEQRKGEIAQGLPGKNLMELIAGTSESVRKGALFCTELISTTMARAVLAEDGRIRFFTFDTTVRGLMRAVITQRYKFARYFSEHNTPTTLEALLQDNNIELYDLESDPEELINLGIDPERNAELIMEMNALLNSLIATEIGVDDGAVFRDALATYLASQQQGNSD